MKPGQKASHRAPDRGEVWFVDLEPVIGHEQGLKRPVVVVSDDGFNHGPAGLVMIVPMTTRVRPGVARINVAPPEGGLLDRSDILVDQLRTISTSRLIHHVGRLAPATMAKIEDRLRMLLVL